MRRSEGVVTEIQRWSLHDGEGLRTTVFLKGCPLRCRWCHNPETHDPKPEILWRPGLCEGCGVCVETCPVGAVRLEKEALTVDKDRCTGCEACVEACPEKALSLSGRIMSVEEVMAVVERDAVFYRTSGGGVTFSGGEPTWQKTYLEDLVDACWAVGYPTAIETSMHFEWEALLPVLGKLDRLFADLKHMDSGQHRKWTGAGNETILANLKKAGTLGKPITIRIPLIAGVNDTDANISATAGFLGEHLSGCTVELLPYHTWGKDKYAGIGKRFEEGFRRPSEDRMRAIEDLFRDRGVLLEKDRRKG